MLRAARVGTDTAAPHTADSHKFSCSNARRGMPQLPWRRLAQLRIEHAHLSHNAIPYLLQGGLRNRLLRAVEGLRQGGGEAGRQG